MTLADKRVFVTGASGFLGGALSRRLAAEGAQVRALTRNPDHATYIQNIPNIELVQGSITDADRMHSLMSGCDYVFHAAVNYGSWDEQHQVNVGGTRIVAQAAAETGAIRLVAVSSIAVYGYARIGLLSESSPLSPTPHEPYGITKAKSEAAVREIGQRRGLSYSIIRPGMIYGPRSGQWTENLFRLARRRPLIWVGDGSGSTFPIHVDDVVDLMMTTATHTNAHNETFNCVSSSPVTWREFMGAYAALVDNNTWVGIPVSLITMLTTLIGDFAPAGTQVKALPTAARSLTRHATIDMRKAQDLLDWSPQYNLESGIATCVPYLREKGLL
ncbi:MAG: NAD(P)-dependent oxidoreductase [Anaerolineae bacterium]|nr:NAD(P)-dependent oxidoreductase [Anaerolineae bacterium]